MAFLIANSVAGQVEKPRTYKPVGDNVQQDQSDQDYDSQFGEEQKVNSNKPGLKNGKLLDDSTKQIYGPTTTRYTFEKNIKYNDSRYYVIDTLLTNIHQFNYMNNYGNKRQDLGFIGSASIPMFIELPELIGVDQGISIYDVYQLMPDNIKYYNTRSPYTDMNIVMGGNNRSITEARYSRNINPNLNVGFDFHGLFIDKQLQSSGKGDRIVLKNSYDVYSHFHSKNGKYELLFNFVRNLHKVNEYGGVLVSNDSLISAYFEDDVSIDLEFALARELRTNFHLFQQYKFSGLLQAYYQVDRLKKMNDYNDEISKEPEDYYDWVRYSPSTTSDRIDFHSVTQEVGVKGDVGKTFYNVYFKHRNHNADYNNVEGRIKGRERGGENEKREMWK